MGDGPLLLRFAPQRKGDGASAEHLILPFSGEDVLELDVTEQCLRFGDEIVDRLMTATAALDDDLLGSLIGLLRLGNGKWNLAFFLLRAFVRRREPFPRSTAAASAAGAASASISVGSFSSLAPPVVAHPAQISDTSTSRVSAARA